MPELKPGGSQLPDHDQNDADDDDDDEEEEEEGDEDVGCDYDEYGYDFEPKRLRN